MSAPRPCGSWPSPLGAGQVSAGQIRYAQPRLDGRDAYWLETRPAENGRTVLVRATAGGSRHDLTPAPCSVRSRVHEYGGGAYAVQDGRVYFVDDADQCLKTLEARGLRAITAPSPRRYADLVVDAPRKRLLCVCEDHGSAPPVNFLAAVSLEDGRLVTLRDGFDFFSSPALSPDGRRLAWLAWNHPQMPWDGCELWLAELDEAGRPRQARRIAGGTEESVFQPRFSPDGVLHFVSDRSGYWNIYRYADGAVHAVAPDAADYGYAQWNCGMSSYGFRSASELVAVRIESAQAEVVCIETATGRRRPLATRYTHIEHLDAGAGGAVWLGGAPGFSSTVTLHTQGEPVTLAGGDRFGLDERFISEARPVCFPTGGGETAFAWYYPPRHPDWRVPDGEPPPLIVKCHGGPTAMNGNALDPRVQFWTSRGYALMDVNYRGSTGFGRAYRRSLAGQWGVKDVEDCLHAARHLVAQGLADPRRLIVSGSSAGGFTALAALAFHDLFRAGTVYYGIGELETAMRDTHKFEAHYGDTLLGPWPAARDVYRARSPLYAADRIRAPVLFFQGLKDKVVPPEQTARMLAALRANRVPVACLTFAEEGHGFRRADTLRRCLEAERVFHARVFGLAPAEALPPLAIEGLP